MSSSKQKEEQQKKDAARRRQEEGRRKEEQRRRDADRKRREAAEENRKKKNKQDAERKRKRHEEEDRRAQEKKRRRSSQKLGADQQGGIEGDLEKEDMTLDEDIEAENRGSGKKKEQFIRLCPRCKKPMTRPASNVSGWFGPKEFACDHCGYTGHFFIEVDPNEVDLQKLDELNKGKRQLDEFEVDEEE